MTAKKTYVLDTNVLLCNPSAMFVFDEHDVVIPIYVIEELDRLKKESSSLGRNARQAARELDALDQTGSLSTGVLTPGGGSLRVVYAASLHDSLSSDVDSVDSKIIATALTLATHAPVILVSRDTNVRLRARALGLAAETFEAEKVDLSEIPLGYTELTLHAGEIDEFFSTGSAKPPAGTELDVNSYVVLKSDASLSQSALAKMHPHTRALSAIRKIPKEGVWGIRPKNKEQSFALDLLLDDNIKLAFLVGIAGTGKTLLAVAAGLQKVLEDETYNKLIVSRPVVPMGKDIGYLPGTVEEKLNPWMQPIYDNVEFLMNLSKSDKRAGRGPKELIDMGAIAIEPLTYIRGRSIPNQYIIVDEAQNLTPHEVKTIITRVGEGTKIVLTGDPYQIDNPYLDATNNGLVFAMQRFKNTHLAGHIILSKGERSELAEMAAQVL